MSVSSQTFENKNFRTKNKFLLFRISVAEDGHPRIFQKSLNFLRFLLIFAKIHGRIAGYEKSRKWTRRLNFLNAYPNKCSQKTFPSHLWITTYESVQLLGGGGGGGGCNKKSKKWFFKLLRGPPKYTSSSNFSRRIRKWTRKLHPDSGCRCKINFKLILINFTFWKLILHLHPESGGNFRVHFRIRREKLLLDVYFGGPRSSLIFFFLYSDLINFTSWKLILHLLWGSGGNFRVHFRIRREKLLLDVYFGGPRSSLKIFFLIFCYAISHIATPRAEPTHTSWKKSTSQLGWS